MLCVCVPQIGSPFEKFPCGRRVNMPRVICAMNNRAIEASSSLCLSGSDRFISLSGSQTTSSSLSHFGWMRPIYVRRHFQSTFCVITAIVIGRAVFVYVLVIMAQPYINFSIQTFGALWAGLSLPDFVAFALSGYHHSEDRTTK